MSAPKFNTIRAREITVATCRRCEGEFRYFRLGRHRYFCEPCREIEKQESTDFCNAKAKAARLAARRNAQLIHAEASV